MQPLYTATAQAIGGRNGHVETSDKLLKFDLSIPKSLGGPGLPNTTNPEQLFACGYAACFGSALEFVAKQKQKALTNVNVTAAVSIGKKTSSTFGLAVELKIYLPEFSHEEAVALVQAAHQVCPYSTAIHNNVKVTLNVVDTL